MEQKGEWSGDRKKSVRRNLKREFLENSSTLFLGLTDGFFGRLEIYYILPENCLIFASRFTQFPGQKNLRSNFQESVTTDAFDGFSIFFGTCFFAGERCGLLGEQKCAAPPPLHCPFLHCPLLRHPPLHPPPLHYPPLHYPCCQWLCRY